MRNLKIEGGLTMKSLSFAKTLSVMIIVLAFLAMSLPQTYQAQGIRGSVVMEREPNGDGMSGPQTIPFPSTVWGSSGGALAQFVVPTSVNLVPAAIDGSPLPSRTTMVVYNLNGYADTADLYRITLNETTNIAINLVHDGSFRRLSEEAHLAFFGGTISEPSIASDLDLILTSAQGGFIDGSFNGLGFTVIPDAGLGFPPGTFAPFNTETIPNDDPSLQGNPLFVPTALPRGRYIVSVDDFTKTGGFLIAGGGELTGSEVVWAYDSAIDNPYTLVIGNRGLAGGQPPDHVEPIGRNWEVELLRFTTRTVLMNKPSKKAADEYFQMEVVTPGTYTVNVGMAQTKRRQAGAPGHLHLLRYDEMTGRWSPVGKSTIVYDGFETLADIQLDSGRYMIGMVHNDIKPYKGRFNYAITVLDENGEFVARANSFAIKGIDVMNPPDTGGTGSKGSK